MNLQIYFSAATQKYFGISPTDLPKDSEVDLSSDWWSLWRCDFLASSEDESERLFIFTNEATRFSLIVPAADDNVGKFLCDFQNTMLHYLSQHGAEVPQDGIKIMIDLIRGRHNSLIASMNDHIYHALYNLCERQLPLDEIERHLHNLPSRMLELRSPGRMFANRLATHSPLPYTSRQETISPDNVLMFPGAALS